jgi:hypothetical protein
MKVLARRIERKTEPWRIERTVLFTRPAVSLTPGKDPEKYSNLESE